MRKDKTSVILAVAAIFAASCQPEEEFGSLSTVPEGDVTITATFEQPDDGTKTSMSSTGKVLWSAGDEVALMTPATKDKFTLTSGDKSGSAGFTGTITGTAPYYLLYPYSDGCTVADGKLKFSLPQVQTISKAGTFAQGASPAVAFMSDYGVQAQFKNLCGILEINVCGTSVTVAKVVVSDLGGNSLWGDCEVALDGTQGTDEQKMTVSGGSNTIILDMEKPIGLKAASSTLFEAVVPVGALNNGFTVKFFDEEGNAIDFLTAQTSAGTIKRSMVSVMKKTKLTDGCIELKDVATRGYYKDMFVDAGVSLNNVCDPPTVDEFGWQHDYVLTTSAVDSVKQSTLQKSIIVGSDDDLNGVLLYPDGEPRFRMVYLNGGHSIPHGTSLTAAGRANYATFVDNGGSFVGTCAGAYISGTGHESIPMKQYLGLVPISDVFATGLSNSQTDFRLSETSPLLRYYDFGGDMKIDSVRHNGGCYLEESLLPDKVEVLAYYIRPGLKIDGKVSTWAYKENDVKGRVVVTGSHPEDVKTGERLNLMEAMCRYAVDGNGKVTEKGVLTNGEERKMDQLSSAGKPENACIGDRQYHHFKLEIPAGGAKNFTLKLASESGKNLSVALRKGDFAWRSEADYLLVNAGSNKTLSIGALQEGIWYVSVYGMDSPVATCAANKFTYSGDTSLLNGVPYSITASWE